MRNFLLLALFFFTSCSNPTEQILPTSKKDKKENKEESEYISIDLETLKDLAFPSPKVIKVNYDHSLKKAKRYEAYPFQPVWNYLIKEYNLDTAKTQIVFECKDGYLAPNTLSELLQAGGGYLAFRDLDAPEGALWPEAIEKKYAPYYLVWKDVPANDHHLAWPYGLVKIRLFKEDPYASIYPQDQPHLAKAFKNYKLHCIKCHSINKIGGDMGPEFNIPKNITEYWSRKNIIAYFSNPKSFRYNTKMYPIKGLNEAEKEGIVDYLEYIANHKISLSKDTK